MPLTFPTLAEQCLASFRNSTKTISLATIARDMRAEVRKGWDVTEYTRRAHLAPFGNYIHDSLDAA